MYVMKRVLRMSLMKAKVLKVEAVTVGGKVASGYDHVELRKIDTDFKWVSGYLLFPHGSCSGITSVQRCEKQ